MTFVLTTVACFYFLHANLHYAVLRRCGNPLKNIFGTEKARSISTDAIFIIWRVVHVVLYFVVRTPCLQFGCVLWRVSDARQKHERKTKIHMNRLRRNGLPYTPLPEEEVKAQQSPEGSSTSSESGASISHVLASEVDPHVRRSLAACLCRLKFSSFFFFWCAHAMTGSTALFWLFSFL